MCKDFFKTSVLVFFFGTYNDIQKESYKITNINVWQLMFPINLTFSYQNSQFSIVIVVNVF